MEDLAGKVKCLLFIKDLRIFRPYVKIVKQMKFGLADM